jgi:hypothetical protein
MKRWKKLWRICRKQILPSRKEGRFVSPEEVIYSDPCITSAFLGGEVFGGVFDGSLPYGFRLLRDFFS